MSLYKNYYIIAGYDLTPYKTDKYEDWKWTDEGEQYICRQSKGNIQLFDDPMDGNHLYLGFVFMSADEYEFRTTVINIDEFLRQQPYVFNKLRYLVDIEVINKRALSNMNLRYEMIAFEECN